MNCRLGSLGDLFEEGVMLFFNDERQKLVNASSLYGYCNWMVTDRAAVYDEELFDEVYRGFEMIFYREDLDEVERKRDTYQLLEYSVNEMKVALPDYIRNQVADFRVFAMGTVTRQVLDEIEAYSKEAARNLAELDEEYEKLHRESIEHMSERAVEAMERSFHDSRVIDCGYEGVNLFFKIKMDGGYERLKEQYTKLVFTDAEILEGQLSIELCVWIYHELYYKDGCIELHVNFSGGNIIIRATDIYSEYFYSFLASDTPIPEKPNEERVFGAVKDLIASGKMTREETLDHPLREALGYEEFENMHIMLSGDFDSFGKLAVCTSPYREEFSKLSKKYIYEINFGNEWRLNIEDMSENWMRGEELLQFIKENCNMELEFWTIWSDHYNNLKAEEYYIDEIGVTDLETIFKNDANGIGMPRRIIVRTKDII